ncbi:hypothetical protein Tco_1373380, partial [Tanacetum coccineum]
TKVSASGEAQEEDISPTTLEAAKTLSKVASQGISKARSTDKGKRYKRKTRTTDKDIGTSLDAEVKVNTGRVEVNPGSAGVNTGSTPVSTPCIVQKVNVIVPSPDKGQREGKAQMSTEDVQATKRTKEQIRQEEADLAEA